MGRLSACILLSAFVCHASDDPASILDRTRKTLDAHLARAANYACVETVERKYFTPEVPLRMGCSEPAPASEDRVPEKLWMRDRLRLDVAVSEGKEIYSWHGEARFTSSDISEVVNNGTISSGSFIGFLQNIFFSKGPQFFFDGEAKQNGARVFKFRYVVPLEASGYRVHIAGEKPAIPFHGSFSVGSLDSQLVSLQVVADKIPANSRICSAESNITYQMATISGRRSLIPASFALSLESDTHVHTISSSSYSGCREFRGESSIHFDPAPVSSSTASASDRPGGDQWLPAGMSLHIGLRTPLDDLTSYVGDPVTGVLLHDINVPGTRTRVRKGAFLQGVIIKLEDHYGPVDFQLVTVRFNRLNSQVGSFRLNALPKRSARSAYALHRIYGSTLPLGIEADFRKGELVSVSPHLHLDHDFAAEWVTVSPAHELTSR